MLHVLNSALGDLVHSMRSQLWLRCMFGERALSSIAVSNYVTVPLTTREKKKAAEREAAAANAKSDEATAKPQPEGTVSE